MDFDFEKTIAMLDGKSAQDFEANQITDKDREIVAHAIDVLFTGLALREWLGNVTLGVAWLRAMDMLRDTVFSIPVKNLMTDCVRCAAFDYIRKKKMQMTAIAHTNEYIKCPVEKRDAWIVDAENKIADGSEILRRLIMDFQPRVAYAMTERASMTGIRLHPENARECEREMIRERKK